MSDFTLEVYNYISSIDLFTSKEVADNELIFYNATVEGAFGLYKKTPGTDMSLPPIHGITLSSVEITSNKIRKVIM